MCSATCMWPLPFHVNGQVKVAEVADRGLVCEQVWCLHITLDQPVDKCLLRALCCKLVQLICAALSLSKLLLWIESREKKWCLDLERSCVPRGGGGLPPCQEHRGPCLSPPAGVWDLAWNALTSTLMANKGGQRLLLLPARIFHVPNYWQIPKIIFTFYHL